MSVTLRELDLRLAALRELLDAKIDAVQLQIVTSKESVAVALAASERATVKAEAATQSRFESINEFRGAMEDQQRTYMPRLEYESKQASALERIQRVEDLTQQRFANMDRQLEGIQSVRLGVKQGWGYVAGVIGLILFLVSIGAAVLTVMERQAPIYRHIAEPGQ